MKFQLYIKFIEERFSSILGIFVLIAAFDFSLPAFAVADHDLNKADHSRYIEGEKTYKEYCSRCHGVNADGRGRVAPLFIKLKTPRPSNFKIKFYTIRPAEYLESVVRDGGEAHSLSKSMPPFGKELSKSQISNVVHFIKNVSLHANAKK